MSTARARGVALLLVLAAVTAVLVARPATEPAPGRASAGTQPVRSTRLGCPDLPGGTVRAGHAGGRTAAVTGADGPTVRATGPAAVGLFAWRTDRPAGRTLSATACVAPRADGWFSGAGAGLDHSSTLVVADLDPGPAVVDLQVLGPDGPVETVGTRGILLAPGTRRRFSLAALAPQTDELTLRVRAERGRVSASVLDTRRESASARTGREWLPAADRAARTVWVAGLPATARGRTLLVANPTQDEAVVDVAVSGRDGTFAPRGLGQDLRVEPGSVRSVDLTRVLAGVLRPDEPAAVRVRSTEPVVAAVRSTGAGDETVAGTVAPLTGPAAAPALRGATTTVRLTATGTSGPPAHATVTAYDAQGRRLASTELTVAPGATVAWRAAAAGGTADHVLVRPTGSAPLVGAVTWTDADGGVAAAPLVDLPVRVLRPAVEPGP